MDGHRVLMSLMKKDHRYFWSPHTVSSKLSSCIVMGDGYNTNIYVICERNNDVGEDFGYFLARSTLFVIISLIVMFNGRWCIDIVSCCYCYADTITYTNTQNMFFVHVRKHIALWGCFDQTRLNDFRIIISTIMIPIINNSKIIFNRLDNNIIT